jgi:3-phosphoshikimate 1-carboxyvinyltransferase
MDSKFNPVAKIEGAIEVPGDKSISHRGLILGAMTEGESVISNLSTGRDCASSIDCLRSLGIEIDERDGSEVSVHGRGISGFRQPSQVLDAQNSGTTMRLLCGALAGQSFRSVITGDRSLRRRPMERIVEPLRRMGAEISASAGDTQAPIMIVGRRLSPMDYSVPVASAQVKSAILIAGLFCRGETVVREPVPTRDHTERLLEYLGADISISSGAIAIKGGTGLTARDIFVPGDVSSAIYFVLAAILLKDSCLRIVNVGLNPGRTGWIEALKQMGADIVIAGTGTRNHEPFGEIRARSSGLKAIEIGPEMVPSIIDEIPALALAATQADGRTVIRGAGELRFKESDRLRSIAVELKNLGARVVETEDGLEIEGPTRLTGTTCQAHGDHRMVMTLAVAALIARGPTVVEDAEAVDISFPGFLDRLSTLTGGQHV